MTPLTPFSASHPPSRILVIRLGAVGDVVRTLPAVRLLRRCWPEASIGWAVEEGAAPLLEGHPDLDEVLVFQRRQAERALRSFSPRAFGVLRDYVRRMRAFGPVLALDFQSSLKSGLLLRFSRASHRVGFDRGFTREGAHLFANHRVQLPEARIHRVLRAEALALAAGASPGTLEADLALSAEELEEAGRHLSGLSADRRPVLLAPFSSRRQAWKRYPLERWAEIARRLALKGFAAIILSGPGEAEEVRQLCAAGGEAVRPCGDLNLRQLAALISRSPLLIGGDTGPMHLGWAGGARIVAIYGPTDPVLNAPFGDHHVVLAPPATSRRDDEDRFPGITPEIVANHAARLMTETTE